MKMTDSQEVIGPWTRVKILGYGGFGQVTLWYKKETEEYIAIKRPQESESKGWIKDKQMERWCKEVEMMKKLNHLNIVKALNVPKELESLSKAPILAMEYCGLGDLRQVLNKPENCCGLTEPTIIKILRDISSGLSYLHSCKVIHRDLKPDNIVLQSRESVVIYKLIDLGYAKELDQNSVCKSFVGTIQYLAPELFLGKLYSSSVDYWSFGIVAHELITGYRPFLPGCNPAEWMKRVQNKPRNVISVIENLSGEIIFSSTISRVNHVSRCLLQDIEKWLELALDWDGDARGKDPATRKLVFFDALKEILKKRTIKVFSLPTYEILCYQINEDTDVYTLKTWLQRDTGISADEQILLLYNGKCLEASGLLVNSLKKEEMSPNSISVYLYNCGSMKIRSRVVLKPLYVKELLENPKKLLAYKHLKRSCSDSVFFLKSELQLFECLLEAVKVKIANVQSRQKSVESLLEDACEEWCQVESFGQFLIMSQKADLENYIQLRKDGELQSTELVQKWIHKVADVEKKLSELMATSNKKKLKLAVEEAREKCKGLENNEFIQTNDMTVLNESLMTAQKIWSNIHNIPKENRGILRSNTEIVKILYRCIEYTTKLLRSPLLDLIFLYVSKMSKQLSEAEEHLTKLVSPLTIWLKSTKIMRQIIENTQRDRQKEIWNLVVRQKGQSSSSKASSLSPSTPPANPSLRSDGEPTDHDLDSNFSPFHIPKTVRMGLKSPVTSLEEELAAPAHPPPPFKPNFKIMEPVMVSHKSDLQLNRSDIPYGTMRSLESDSIISTNNYLRYKVQEMNQSWLNLIKDMKSLNWDSLKEEA